MIEKFKPNNEGKAVSVEKKEIIEELVKFGKENGNNLDFKDSGKDFNENKEFKIKKEVLENIEKENLDTVVYSLKILKTYVAAPIFTDDFHENHSLRREWENNVLSKIRNEAYEFYKTNCLGVNACSGVIGFIGLVADLIGESDLKNKLTKLIKIIPNELQEHTEKGILKYQLLTDEKKIEVVKKLKEIAEETISLLEEKI